jgi:hypothetical protein
MKRVFAVAGIILLSSAAVWRFGLAHRWTQRLPPGWSWTSVFVGFMTYADPQTGQLPARDVTTIYERRMAISSEADRPRAVSLEDVFVGWDPKTRQKVWEYITHAVVDPATGAHLQEEYAGDIYVFPRMVEKRVYRFRNNYVKGVPLAFQREEEVEGVLTYLFAYKGRGEYTESYAGTADYPGVRVAPGQEIKCADDQFVFKAWVEPVTGELLKLEESCYSGDYVYDIATGEQLAAIERWAGITGGDDVVRRADHIRRERTKYLLAARYFPAALLLAGLVCCGCAAAPSKPQGGRR